MQLIADLHTHSIASTHAFATITEMVKEASALGLFAIAITDHGRTMPGAPGAYYFESLHAIPSTLYGVRVLKGIEANITDYNGTLDADKRLLDSLDWVVASMHTVTLSEKPTVEKCTQAYLSLAENKNVNVIGHSGTPYYKYDYEAVIPVLAKNGVLIEINDSTFRYKKDSMSNCCEIIKLCKKHNARVCVNSDAHYFTSLGRMNSTLKVLEELSFPPELVVNSSIKNLTEYMSEKGISIV